MSVIISIHLACCWLAITPELEGFLCLRKQSYRSPLSIVHFPLSSWHTPTALLNTPERKFRFQIRISLYGTYFPLSPLIVSKCKIHFTSFQHRWSRKYWWWIRLEITTQAGVQPHMCNYFNFRLYSLYWEGSNPRLLELSDFPFHCSFCSQVTKGTKRNRKVVGFET